MKKKKSIKKEELIHRILGLIILLPIIYYICRRIYRLPIMYYNVIELLFCIFLIFLLGYVLVSLYFKIVRGKFLNKLLTLLTFSLVILYSCLAGLNYKRSDLITFFKIPEVFSTRTYENKVVVPTSSNGLYTGIETPSNIDNIVIYNTDDVSLNDTKITVLLCKEDKCEKAITRDFILEDDRLIIVLDSGYGVDSLVIDSETEENWIEKIEYNDQNFLMNMQFNMTSSELLLYSVITIIVIVLLYMLLVGIKKVFVSDKKSSILEKIKTRYRSSKIKFKIEDIFLVLGLTMGLIFCFAIPPYNIPDEGTHIAWAYRSIGYEYVSEQIYENYYCETCQNVIMQEDERINEEQFTLNNKVKLTDNSFKTPVIAIRAISYFPQIIGVLIGQFLDLPIYWILMLGEIFAVFFYVSVGYLILKILPFKKEIMFLALLLPMTIQQCSSFSYDATSIMLSYLNFTLIMRLWYLEKAIRFKEILPIIALTMALAVIKLPYALVGLALFVIPLNRFKFKFKKHEISLSDILKNKLVIFLLILFFIMGMVFVAPKVDFGRWLITSFLEPVHVLSILINTVKVHATGLMTSLIANFGWLNTEATFYFILFITVFMMFISFYKKKDDDEKKLPLYAKLILLGIFLTVSALIAIAMLYAWTIPRSLDSKIASVEQLRAAIASITVIEGIQGRYFLPILPLILFIPNRCNIRIKDKEYNILTILLYLISFAYSIYLLLFRFWL